MRLAWVWEGGETDVCMHMGVRHYLASWRHAVASCRTTPNNFAEAQVALCGVLVWYAPRGNDVFIDSPRAAHARTHIAASHPYPVGSSPIVIHPTRCQKTVPACDRRGNDRAKHLDGFASVECVGVGRVCSETDQAIHCWGKLTMLLN